MKEFKEKLEEIDELVKQIKDLFEVLERKYSEIKLNLDCSMKSSYYQDYFKYSKIEEYQNLIKELDNISNERRKLILELESNSKTSKVYQNAINKFIKKLEGEK